MKKSVNIKINREGDLLVESSVVVTDQSLFEMKEAKSAIRVYSHDLKALVAKLRKTFPQNVISCKENMEELIRDEFVHRRGIVSFKTFLDYADIPHRYSNVAA